jgi:hypothetical protein
LVAVKTAVIVVLHIAVQIALHMLLLKQQAKNFVVQ